MNIVVLGEGPDELGPHWNKRNPFDPIPSEGLGALEILVRRVAGEVYRCDVQLVALPRLRRHGVGKTGEVALAEAIKDPEQLRQLLVSPGAHRLQAHAAEAAVVACDKNQEDKVAAALRQACQSSNRLVAAVVFNPEFEVLFFDKRAIEKAKALVPCALGAPPNENELQRLGQAKEPLKQWLEKHCSVNAEFLKQVAKNLSLPGSRPALKKLCEDMGGLFGPKKGPPAGDQIS